MRTIVHLLMLSMLAIALFACANKPQPIEEPPAATPQGDKMQVTSVAFKEGQSIPKQYTCDGINISPPLEWSGAPKTTKSIAVICDDPDAPMGTWVHWVLYNLPGDKIGLIENTPTTETLVRGGMQGTNDFKKFGYGGPCPPSGTHRYFFKVYALDSELPLKPGATKAEVEKAMEGHIVGQAQLMGTYKR